MSLLLVDEESGILGENGIIELSCYVLDFESCYLCEERQRSTRHHSDLCDGCNGRIFTLGVEPSANVGSLKRDVLAPIDIPYRSGQVVLGKMEEDSSNSCANVPICVKYCVHGADSNI